MLEQLIKVPVKVGCSATSGTCSKARLKDFHAVHRSLKPLSSARLSEASKNKIASQVSSNWLGFLGGFGTSDRTN
jgi:hypothetical protein